MSALNYLLHESAAGYSIFEVVAQPDTIGNRLPEVQAAANDLALFGKMVRVVNFAPFRGSKEALENINMVCCSSIEFIANFLSFTLLWMDRQLVEWFC